MFLLFVKYYIVFSVKPAICKTIEKIKYFINKFLRKKKPTINLDNNTFDFIKTIS